MERFARALCGLDDLFFGGFEPVNDPGGKGGQTSELIPPVVNIRLRTSLRACALTYDEPHKVHCFLVGIVFVARHQRLTTPKPTPQDLLRFSDPAELTVGPRRTYRLSSAELATARSLANEVVGSSDPGPAVAKFVHDHVRPAYGLSRYKRGPLAVLEAGRGDCLEAHVVVALLLRSLGVPCRFISEIAAARFEIGQALCALLRKSAAGPWTNTHVWTETWDGEAWQPLDTTFGVYGRNDWVAERLCPDGSHFGGFRFPLQIRSRDADGAQADLSGPYLLEPFAEQQDSAAFCQWAADVAHFARLRRESPYLGARLVFQGARFRRMTRNLKVLLAVR